MAIDILQSATAAVRLRAPDTWTNPACTCYAPGGTALATPTATHSVTDVNTTVQSAANAYTVTLTSATNVATGRWYRIKHANVNTYHRVLTLASSTVTLWPPLYETPTAGDIFAGAEVYFTIPAAATGTLDANHYAVVTCDEGLEQRIVYHVVRRRFIDAVTFADVQGLIFTHWASNDLVSQQVIDLVDDVQQELRAEIMATGRYPHILVDPVALRRVGMVVAKILLVREHGLVPPGRDDPEAYLDELEAEKARLLGRVLGSIQAMDADDDGSVDDESPTVLHLRIRR